MPVANTVRARVRRIAAAGLAFALSAGVMPGVVLAHGGADVSIRTSVDALPDALAPIRVQVHQTVASQLVLENRGDTPIALLDDNGRAFARIGPAGVLVDKHAEAYYRVRAPTTGERLPGALREAEAPLPPKWVRVSAESSWGWFDPRVDKDGVEVPEAVKGSADPKVLSSWRIPVRYGETKAAITGKFHYQPLQVGRFVARIRGGAEVAPGVYFGVAQAPVPSMYVNNESGEPVVILDRDERPWFRVGGGVFRNVAREHGATEWVRIGGGQRHSWSESRAAYPKLRPPQAVIDANKGGVTLDEWRVPIEVAGKRHTVKGDILWYPDEEAAVSSSDSHH